MSVKRKLDDGAAAAAAAQATPWKRKKSSTDIPNGEEEGEDESSHLEDPDDPDRPSFSISDLIRKNPVAKPKVASVPKTKPTVAAIKPAAKSKPAVGAPQPPSGKDVKVKIEPGLAKPIAAPAVAPSKGKQTNPKVSVKKELLPKPQVKIEKTESSAEGDEEGDEEGEEEEEVQEVELMPEQETEEYKAKWKFLEASIIKAFLGLTSYKTCSQRIGRYIRLIAKLLINSVLDIAWTRVHARIPGEDDEDEDSGDADARAASGQEFDEEAEERAALRLEQKMREDAEAEADVDDATYFTSTSSKTHKAVEKKKGPLSGNERFLALMKLQMETDDTLRHGRKPQPPPPTDVYLDAQLIFLSIRAMCANLSVSSQDLMLKLKCLRP
jgi:hypothetical protein